MATHRQTTWRVGILLSAWSIIFFTPSTPAQVNSWTNNIGGKWETPGAWSLDVVPSINQSSTFVTNGFFTGFSLKDVVIDATTAASAPGSLNISNLVISAPIVHGTGPAHQGFNVLIISNATLTVQNTLALSTGGALTVTNAELQLPGMESFGCTEMDVLLSVDGSVVLESGSIYTASDIFQFYGPIVQAIGVNSYGTLTVAGSYNYLGSGMAVGENGGSVGTVWLTSAGSMSVGGDNYLGQSGTGSLIQSNGSYYAYGEFLGYNPGAQGTLTVLGGSHYVDADGLIIGPEGGTGSVWMNGGLIQETNAYAEIVSGALTQSNGVMELFGLIDYGTMTLAGGIKLIGNGGVLIENTGTVWVTGGQLIANSFDSYTEIDLGSLVQSNSTVELFGEIVGDEGVGTLTVADGTHQVGFGGLALGHGSGSTGTVWITGGDLSATVLFSDISIGTNGVGSLILSNGSVEADSEIVGGGPGAQGTLTIAGGTSFVGSDLTIGTPDCTGTGTVIVSGGSLFVTNADHDAVLDLENGKLLVSGGTVVLDQMISTNPCGVFQQTGGTLVVGGVTNTVGSFEITSILVVPTNSVLITWTDNAGQTNIVQATNGTGGNYATNFTDLSSPIILTGSGNVTTNYLDVGGATNSPSRFYRVRVAP